MDPRQIKIEDYDYDLPAERIASVPVEPRDSSKLLRYRGGEIDHHTFRSLPGLLDDGDLLVYNNAKVIHARLPFVKPTGGAVEIFCLEPSHVSVEEGLSARGKTRWNCLVGGAKKWKEGHVTWNGLNEGIQDLSALMISRGDNHFEIEFTWSPDHLSWGEILESAGNIPLPPYIQRAAVAQDEENYQTVYARQPGSVAAPTAGLHFSDSVLEELGNRKIKSTEVTLHVGAGTFKPVSADTIGEHHMHGESVFVSIKALKDLRDAKRIVAVGTTSTRTLESLYWLATDEQQRAGVAQWQPYEQEKTMSREEALQGLITEVEESGEAGMSFVTDIIIVPGYRMRMVDVLITNFHMPKSTLLLLIAALIGDDWKKVYDEAMKEDYRFLSFGDSSILIPQKSAAH